MVTNYRKAQTGNIDASVWQRYEATKDIGLRNEILMSYLYIITCNIKKMQSITKSRDDLEDMTNQGVLELISCIERYDWKRGIQFDSYASIRVRGSIIDYIRKKDWIPRDTRKRVKQLEEEYNALENKLGRQPSDVELAERLGISEAEINKIRYESMTFNVMAFEELLADNDMTLLDITENDDAQSPDGMLIEEELKEKLAGYIDELGEKEKTVISLYYYDELKLKEIAFVMGLTISRVSQIHSKAVSKLREKMQKYMDI
ncbi:MAG: FliA/WhiG family RNA polymerase sigma factor [Oscillospiraceae bacterium]|nr:FliA/WhiG family RNA polymerase sigma factor [Oscillospiraceae bacterium]